MLKENPTMHSTAQPYKSHVMSAAARQVFELIAESQHGAIDSARLMALYRQLEPVSVPFMLGTWHGSLFNGQSGDG